jgi:thiamine-phosphate diphosphorylase
VRGLYAIVDVPHPHGLDVADVTAAVLEGASAVQLRAKHASTHARIRMLARMVPACERAAASLWVNDDLDAALALAGDVGLHLGQGDPGVEALDVVRAAAAAAGKPALAIGVSTHDLAQLRAALAQRPAYVAFGPVAPTRSKTNPDPVVGLHGLTDAARASALPVVAIGGLDHESAGHAIEVGASAVAVIGALVDRTPAAIAARARALANRLRDAARPLPLAEVHARIPVIAPEVLAEIARWSDDLAIHRSLGLPARFAPQWRDGEVHYRPSDVVDLLAALGKRADESWQAWHARGDRPELAELVRLRRPSAP